MIIVDKTTNRLVERGTIFAFRARVKRKRLKQITREIFARLAYPLRVIAFTGLYLAAFNVVLAGARVAS